MKYFLLLAISLVLLNVAFAFGQEVSVCEQKVSDYKARCYREPGKSWEKVSAAKMNHHRVILETGIKFLDPCDKKSKAEIESEMFLATTPKIENIRPRLERTCEEFRDAIDHMESQHSECLPMYKELTSECKNDPALGTAFNNPNAWKWGQEQLPKALKCRLVLDWQCDEMMSELQETVDARGGGADCVTDKIKTTGECIH